MISISNKSLVFFQIFNTAYFYCSRYWNFSVLCVLWARRWEVSVHIWYTKVLLYLCTIDVKGFEMPNLFYEMDTDVLLHCCASTVQSDTSVNCSLVFKYFFLWIMLYFFCSVPVSIIGSTGLLVYCCTSEQPVRYGAKSHLITTM